MKLNEVVTQNSKNIKCSNAKCSSEVFGISQQPLNGSGPSIAVVCCKSCGQNMGQLEPNSVITNLGQISSLMTRILPVLERVESALKSAGTLNNRGAQEIKSQKPVNPPLQNSFAKQGAQFQTIKGVANPDDPTTP